MTDEEKILLGLAEALGCVSSNIIQNPYNGVAGLYRAPLTATVVVWSFLNCGIYVNFHTVINNGMVEILDSNANQPIFELADPKLIDNLKYYFKQFIEQQQQEQIIQKI